jgi:hypothetical protein
LVRRLKRRKAARKERDAPRMRLGNCEIEAQI